MINRLWPLNSTLVHFVCVVQEKMFVTLHNILHGNFSVSGCKTASFENDGYQKIPLMLFRL